MILLTFDTCLNKTYITLRKDNNILSSEILNSDDKNYHSAYLISTIKKVLKENNLTPKNVDAIATNIGPGSFTGIRACTTVARIIGQQLGIKVLGISSLEIISHAENNEYIVALDARKNKAYLYDKKLIGAVDLEEVDKYIKNKNVITDDNLFERFKIVGNNVISYQQANYNLGNILSEIAIEKIKTENCDWHNLKPLYIQPPGINISKKK